MRLGVIAESLIERLALRFHSVPEPLLETQMAFSMARSIMAGVKLGLFEAARAHAALEGRTRIEVADVDAVAELVLAHRRQDDAERAAQPPAPAP